MPLATVEAFRDHGRVRRSLTEDLAGATACLRRLAALGIDFEAVTAALQVDDIASFAAAYAAVLGAVGETTP